MFWSAGYSLLRAEGFFCSLDVLFGGLGINKLIKKSLNFCFSCSCFQFLIIKTLDLDPDWYPIQLNMLDPDPESMNPESGSKTLLERVPKKRLTNVNSVPNHYLFIWSKKIWKVHIDEPLDCSLCTKSFGRIHNLQKHIKVHHGDKLFSCSLCKKSFSLSGELRKHSRGYTVEKPNSCSHC